MDVLPENGGFALPGAGFGPVPRFIESADFILDFISVLIVMLFDLGKLGGPRKTH